MPIAAAAGPIVSGIGGIVGGIMGASAAKKAAAAQQQMAMEAAQNSTAAANNATGYNNQIEDLNRTIQNPWIGAGQSAIANVAGRMGLSMPTGLIGGPTQAGMLTTPGAPGAPAPAPAAKAPGYKVGGIIHGPGTSTSDSVPTRLSTGEGVVTAAAMRMPGVTEMVMRMNRASDGKAPKIGGSHFDTGGIVTGTGVPATGTMPNTPTGPTGVMTPGGTGPAGPMTPNSGATPSPGGTGAGAQPFAGTDPSAIADPTVRTIVGAAQGGVNMNSLPGGQTAWQQQPGLMSSLNIGPNGQIPGAPGYAGSNPPSSPSSPTVAPPSGSMGLEGSAPLGQTQGGVMTPATTAGTDANLSTSTGPSGAVPPAPGAAAPTGAAPGSTFDPLSYGNLTQGYDPQFSAPTGVTEQNDPGFQFRLQQGQQALERSAAARGGLLTGGAGKDLANYEQGLASQEYQGTYNRALQTYNTNQNTFYQNQNNLYNRLMGISGAGQNAAGQLTNANTASAGQIGNIDMTSAGQVGQDLTNAGTARASGIVGANNAYGSILPGIGGGLSLYSILNGQKPGATPYTPYNVADYTHPFGN